jgi:hypothetical protein
MTGVHLGRVSLEHFVRVARGPGSNHIWMDARKRLRILFLLVNLAKYFSQKPLYPGVTFGANRTKCPKWTCARTWYAFLRPTKVEVSKVLGAVTFFPSYSPRNYNVRLILRSESRIFCQNDPKMLNNATHW